MKKRRSLADPARLADDLPASSYQTWWQPLRYLSGLCLGLLVYLAAPAQALQVEARIGGGMNWSYSASAPNIKQVPFLTYYGQISLGYWFNPRIGVWVGITEYPIGIRHKLVIDTEEIYRNNTKSHTAFYSFMPQFLVWYAVPREARRLAGSQLGLGVLWAKTEASYSWPSSSTRVYPKRKTLFEMSETSLVPHQFWGIEGRWNYPMWLGKRHRVMASMQLIKGLKPVHRTTRAYYIDFPDQEVRTSWTTYGDYFGLGLAYQWSFWVRKGKRVGSM